MADRLIVRRSSPTVAHRTPAASVPPSALVIYPVVVGLWLAFGATLLVDPGSLVDLWERFRDRSLVVRGVVGLLLLPWVIAVWVWQTDWPLALRLVLDAGLAWATLYAFFPRRRERPAPAGGLP